MKQQLLEAGYVSSGNLFESDYIVETFMKQIGPLLLVWVNDTKVDVLEIGTYNVPILTINFVNGPIDIENVEVGILEMYKVLKGLNNETE